MNRSIAVALLAALAWSSPSLAGEVNVEGKVFRVPEGFVVERVAGPPLVDRPIVADFDELGRLYVADSSGSNDPPAEQLKNPSHRIVRLEDTNGDGVFDKSVVYADKMMFPEGAMWREGSLYVAAPPSIWKLTDTDGDGKADRREEWFKGKTLTGCANDLHGPYNGPDGWIYWCKGAFAEQTYDRPGKPPLKTRAAHIFRARPDGTGVEPVMTGGMDNPVEVAFSPGGERFFTTTFLVQPGGGKRDGIIHAVYGGLYGKDHDAIDGQTRTGPDLMPVMTHLGPAAPSGLMRYESKAFGKDYQDNLFAALFNMHKVTRHVLEPDGATFKTTDSDFLVAAENLDFHPTDVLEDADGSLLVLDTGGWYKLCCPTSQIGKPDVLGAIYRVRRADAPKVDDPRGLDLDWAEMTPAELARLLDDPRPAVRRRAVATLGQRGDDAVPALVDTITANRSPEAVRNAVWASSRIGDPWGGEPASLGLRHNDPSVQTAAIHAASVRRHAGAREALHGLLEKGPPAVQRASAEALGRIGNPAHVPALLDKIETAVTDRVLEHTLTYALVEIGDPRGLADWNDPRGPETRRAAVIALDQMGEAVNPGRVEGMRTQGPRGAETERWFFSHHPEHGEFLAGSLRDRLRQFPAEPGNPGPALAAIAADLAGYASSAPVQALIGEILGLSSTRHDVRMTVLKAMERSGVKPVPATWRTGLVTSLATHDAEVVAQAVKSARALQGGKGEDAGEDALTAALMTVGTSKSLPASVRLDALLALPEKRLAIDPALFAFLGEQIAPDQPVTMRLAAADVLVRSRLDANALASVARILKTAGPLEADRLLPLFDGCADEAIGRELVASLRESPLLGSLRLETLKPRFAKFSEAVQNEAQPLYDLIERAQLEQKSKLDEILATMPEGDLRRGQAVFQSTKAACMTCHAVGYLGGNVGPDLSRIGSIRGDRDLIEAVIYPSASFVRSYEPMVVSTKAGQVHSGILKKDAPDEVVLAVAADKEVRIPRDEVEEMKPGTVSVMPAGLDTQLSKQELSDLLAFLKSRR